MKKVFIFFLVQIIIGCKGNFNIKEAAPSTLFFVQADTLREFDGNSSFVVIGDTVLLSDYYYNYNDNHEISMFKLNAKETTRIFEHQNNGSIELGIDNGRLQVFRRCYNSSYEEYSFRDIPYTPVPYTKKLQFAHTDHLVSREIFCWSRHHREP